MAVFNINLIRQSVLPPEARRSVCCGLCVYVCLWGLLLAWQAHMTTRNLLELRQQERQVLESERRFRETHPGRNDILAYGRESRDQLAAAVATLEAVNALRARRLDVPRLLLALTAPLPREANLTALDLDREKRALNFDLAFALGASAQTLDIGRLTAAWNEDPAIVAQVRKIRSVQSQRQKVDGKTLEVWRFAGAATEDGK